MKYEIGKIYPPSAILDIPDGTVFKKEFAGIFVIGIAIDSLMIKAISSLTGSGAIDFCTRKTQVQSGYDITILDLPTSKYQIGDEIKAEDLQKLPVGSIVRFPKTMCDDFLYLRCEDDNLYRLSSSKSKIHRYGFSNLPLYIEYIGEAS